MATKIAILTDSSAGFTDAEAKEHDIHVIPLHIILNNEIDIYDTEQDTKEHNFYEVVKTGITKTSQVSPGELEQKYDKLLETYDKVIHYPIAEKLSSQYQTAYTLSQNEKYKDKVTVVRNHTAAFALKNLVIYAAKLANSGLSVEEIINKTNNFENNCLMAMVPGNLERLASGGRVKKILITAINLLRIKILLQWGENPKKIATGRTVSSLTQTFGELFKKFSNNVNYNVKLFVLKTSECADKIWKSVSEVLDSLGISYQYEILPNVFVAHAGLDTIAFTAIPTIKN